VWWVGSRPADVFIGESVFGLAAPGERPRWESTGSALEGWRRTNGFLAAKPARRRRSLPIRVWLSGRLARPFLVSPIRGLRRQSEAIQVAQSIAESATGLSGPLRVWLDAWQAGQPCLGIAVEQALVDLIETRNEPVTYRLESIAPWWADAIHACRSTTRQSAWCAVDDGEEVTLIGEVKGSLSHATNYGRLSNEELDSLVARARFMKGDVGEAIVVSLERDPSRKVDSAEGDALPMVFGATQRQIK